MKIQEYFVNGDIRGAIEYMRSHDEYKEILPLYIALFENGEYRHYELPELLDRILLAYQKYYRDIFFFGVCEGRAADKLIAEIGSLLGMEDTDENLMEEKLKELFQKNGYNAQFGKTQGFYGPYIWKETVPVTYAVELPYGTSEYTVNILKGFIFRSWMDYLTFGRFGTGGWASSDGTINCVEQAYDFESEEFLVSLLKHEAQHTIDMKRYPKILPFELEYRAKLVELYYTNNPSLLQKFFSEADGSRVDDSHSVASVRIEHEFNEYDSTNLDAIHEHALELLKVNNIELDEKYGIL